MRYNRLAAFCLTIFAIVVSLGAGNRLHVAAAPGSAAQEPPPCSPDDFPCDLPAVNENDPASVNRYAIDLLTKLMGSGNPNNPDPNFQNLVWIDWQTKCTVLPEHRLCPVATVRDVTPQQASVWRAAHNRGAPSQRNQIFIRKSHYPGVSLLASLAAPVQAQYKQSRVGVLALRDEKIEVNPHTGVANGGAGLASVLYNREAAAGIMNQWQASAESVGLALPRLGAHSIVIKAVWQTLSPGNNNGYGMQASTLTPSLERSLPARMLDPSGKLALGSDAFTNINLGAHNEPACPSQSSPDGPSQPEQNCLRVYHNVSEAPRGIEPADSPQDINCSPTCDLALLGLQMMVRPTATSKWIWVAMWWTGKPGGLLSAKPWSYYAVSVTNQDRSVMVDDRGPKLNIVFNPYLEGTVDTHGAVSNCLNCHMYAAYDKPKTPRFGQPFFGATRLPVGGQQDTPPVLTSAYLRTGISTDQLWSRIPYDNVPAIAQSARVKKIPAKNVVAPASVH